MKFTWLLWLMAILAVPFTFLAMIIGAILTRRQLWREVLAAVRSVWRKEKE
jgi:hypothetical protein